MKKIGCALTVFAVSLVASFAQLGVEVTLDQKQFLSGESVPVTVRISNRSGQTLHLGLENAWLTFDVQSSDGRIVSKLGDVPATGEFTLESAKVAVRHLDLAPFFDIDPVGHYTVSADVRVKAWGYEVASTPTGFDVIHGAKLWEQEIGLPSTNANAMPVLRKYSLQQATYGKDELGLYLRVSDSETDRSIKVRSVGRMLSFSRPEAQVDSQSNLHLLYQDGPRAFSYTVYNPWGELLARQTYDYEGSRPRLRLDAKGQIVVFGGMRHPTAYDEPPLAAATSPDAPPPLVTNPSNDPSVSSRP